MKMTNGKVPEEKFREWGFADKAGIAYVELQYKMIREGMTLEQYDYLESNASLSTATSIAITQLARTAMQKVRQRAVEKQINAAKNVGTEAAGEGNNKGTNKANAAKPDVQQGTAEGANKRPVKNVADILEEATLGRPTKGKTTQYQKPGGFEQASKEFDALNPSNVKNINTVYGQGKTGILSDGRTIILRPGSTDGRPTLEIRNPNGRGIEIRYGK